MLLLSHRRVAEIDVVESGEELVDLRNFPALAVDSRKADGEGAWLRLRAGVVERLTAAQEALPQGVTFLIVEGFRPAALQQRYFDEHRAGLAADHDDWDAERVFAEASQHVAPPSVAPHPCGAAVDLTLLRDGAELDLGTPMNATPAESDGACFTAAENISDDARAWREVMGRALESVGLVNYPPEWWHWSYGDRYWAAVTGAEAAVYAPIEH